MIGQFQSAHMDPDQRHKLLWGWFRILLGIAQMGFAIAGFACLLQLGVTKVSLAFVLTATALTVESRLIFKRK